MRMASHAHGKQIGPLLTQDALGIAGDDRGTIAVAFGQLGVDLADTAVNGGDGRFRLQQLVGRGTDGSQHDQGSLDRAGLGDAVHQGRPLVAQRTHRLGRRRQRVLVQPVHAQPQGLHRLGHGLGAFAVLQHDADGGALVGGEQVQLIVERLQRGVGAGGDFTEALGHRGLVGPTQRGGGIGGQPDHLLDLRIAQCRHPGEALDDGSSGIAGDAGMLQRDDVALQRGGREIAVAANRPQRHRQLPGLGLQRRGMGHGQSKGAPHRHGRADRRQQRARHHAGSGAEHAKAGAGGHGDVGDLMTLLDHRHHHRLPGSDGRHRLHGLHAQLAQGEGVGPGRDAECLLLLGSLDGLAGQHCGGGSGHARRRCGVGERLGGGLTRPGGNGGGDRADPLGLRDLGEGGFVGSGDRKQRVELRPEAIEFGAIGRDIGPPRGESIARKRRRNAGTAIGGLLDIDQADHRDAELAVALG
ncbi:MAG: hypothetical protein NTV19_20720 [Burkholderiales bacterium]|nr:hypothetical protein [Burkholderiales bacterium]